MIPRAFTRKALGPAALLVVLACDSRPPGPVVGSIVSVDSIASRMGVDLFRPSGILARPNGSLYVLDEGNSLLYRLWPGAGRVDTVAVEGSAPRELRRPTAMAMIGDTLVVVDAGNGRLQFFTESGEVIRTLEYARGARSLLIDPEDRTFAAATFGQTFSINNGRPELPEPALVTVLSLEDGSVIETFGVPREYEGMVVPILGNYVQIARDPHTGEVWLAWPLEPELERFSPTGEPLGRVDRALEFTPAAPQEYPSPRSPLPAADVERVTYSIGINPRGELLVLTALGPKVGRVGTDEYQPPPQAVDVLNDRGEVRCRMPLPFTASSMVVSGDDELLFYNVLDVPEIIRVRYRCDAGRLLDEGARRTLTNH